MRPVVITLPRELTVGWFETFAAAADGYRAEHRRPGSVLAELRFTHLAAPDEWQMTVVVLDPKTADRVRKCAAGAVTRNALTG